MILLSANEIEANPEKHEFYYQRWLWLLDHYGKYVNGQRVIEPEDVIDHYIHTVIKTDTGNKHKFVGDLKADIDDIGPLAVSMICAGGYQHNGGKAEVFGDRGIYVMVIKP